MSTTEMGVTFGSLGVLGPQAAPDIARTAQDIGYSSFWTVEATGTDAMTLLGAATVAAPKISLGTGIIPIQLRAPTLAAMTAATLQALNPDAGVLLGVGVSAPGILRSHGIQATDKPIGMMREYVTLLKECLSGESVTFEGDYFQCSRFRLGVRLGERKPKIIMAALNPQMLKLAGEVADGVLLNYLPASHVQSSVEQVRKGGNAKIYAYVHAAVGELEKSANSARRDLFNYAMADGYANMFREAGFEDEVNELREKQRNKDRDGAVAAVSERMIQAINFIGSGTEVTSFVKNYIDAGVEHPVLMPMPWGEDRRAVTEATMRAAIAAL
ncbi:MAG: LLM class flavin-dependent oxidoreductase [Pseudomonadales bacterium]|nr:LLM class flavin-dependent oxidoreductase [Pseudomonadales bacterium]MBO6565003.1 LLM class flavin-dependent oxidoreductase [Pseudomonadales bacterium]MBO6594912.1 LLM class flavin-dependent oxidoreductase [Pseudomonadales bacterium]MBO6658287.1 LLM class flavin-dependent oxidoreductase [Pseudomonadales bacterium]MBO6701418.1 LLM class flavin-dependent oxidoreductase [Pseudomonadales bacterium]